MTLPPYPRPAYAWYVVAVLLVAYIFAFIDRDVIALLVQPIKADLEISDTQMSFLLGGAFALFYTFFGIPIAWLADRWNRKIIIFLGVFTWSIMTALCGLAGSYGALFLARMGVGVGEAALNPPALSLLKDYFPPERLGRAIGLYTAGISCGTGVGSFLSATIYPSIAAAGAITLPLAGTVQPWQFMFILVGLPGVLVALAVLTIREPVRRDTGASAVPVALWTTLSYVANRWRVYILLFLALSVLAILNYGVGYWLPEFLRRTYNLDTAEMSYFLQARGIVLIVVGLASVLVAGYLCDRFRTRYADGYLRVALIGFAFLLVGYTAIPLMPTPELAIAAMVVATIGGAMPTTAGAAAVVGIAPANMRAQITALYYFTLNLIGLTIGPTTVALLTDYVFGNEADLYKSLAVVSFTSCVIGLALMLWCRPHYRRAATPAFASL